MHDLAYLDDEGEEQRMTLPLTIADWAEGKPDGPVGARNTDWAPPPATCAHATSATAVLPQPTSP